MMLISGTRRATSGIYVVDDAEDMINVARVGWASTKVGRMVGESRGSLRGEVAGEMLLTRRATCDFYLVDNTEDHMLVVNQ